jgi:hypothetical protein
MRPSLVCALVLAAAGGCYPPPPVYRVQRSARVPRPTVPLRTGQPLAGPIELTLGASSVADTMRPRGGDDRVAIEIPQHQLRGELRIRLFERGELAVVHERAFGSATKLDTTQADVESGQPWGAGAAWRYSIAPRGERWAVGIDTELLRWSVPYTEIRTCIENCEDQPLVQHDTDVSLELTWGFGITPSYRVDERWTLFGGAFLRNHPTIERKGEEIGRYNDEDTTGGPVNVLVHAGAAVRFGAFTAMLLVHQNLDSDPVRYGPGIGFALSAAIDPANARPPAIWSSDDDDDKLAEARRRMHRAQARRDAAR